MMSSFITHRPWGDVVAFDAAFDAVTREDVMRVANKYLGKNYVAVYRKKGDHEVVKIDKPATRVRYDLQAHDNDALVRAIGKALA